MAMTIHVDIVSAEEEIYSGPAEMVFAPAVMGEIGIAPRHTPLISPLKPGEVRLDLGNGKEEFFFISGGIIEVQPHVVTVLSDTAIRAKDLDEAGPSWPRSRSSRSRAESLRGAEQFTNRSNKGSFGSLFLYHAMLQSIEIARCP